MYSCASEPTVTKDCSDRFKVFWGCWSPLVFDTITVISVAKYRALRLQTK
jgi:hypothetical protein